MELVKINQNQLSLSWNFKQGIQHTQGWLTKTGEWSFSQSRKRYFILDIKQHLLKYYTDSTQTELLGQIDVKTALSVSKSKGKADFTFEIKLKNNARCYELTADTAEEFENWVTTLNNIIAVYSSIEDMEATYPNAFCLFQNIMAISGFLLEHCNISNSDFILALEHGVQVFSRGTPTQDDIIGLIWLLYYKVASYDELFTSGLMRVGMSIQSTHSEDDDDDILFNYFLRYPAHYQRTSSHFKEKSDELLEFGQYGIDIGKNGDFKLPCQKHAILFLKLRDGSFCIKLENSGCPPIWTPEHMTRDDVSSYVNHALDFVNTRTAGNNKLYRKEHVPESYKTIYKAILSDLLKNNPKELSKWFDHGCLFGISVMINVIQNIIDGPMEANKFGDSMAFFQSALVLPKQKEYSFETLGPNLRNYETLYAHILLDKQRGYLGERKGLEVCLPSLDKWSELKNII